MRQGKSASFAADGRQRNGGLGADIEGMLRLVREELGG